MNTTLITGASAGIGAAYADRLANRGHDLVLVARRRDRLTDVADRARSAGVTVETIATDLSTSSGIARVEARLAQGVYGLVNNAGFGEFSPLAAQNRDMLDEMIRLNVIALVRLAHAALQPMLKARAGWIANIASGLAFRPGSGIAVYSGTKAFVLNFSESLVAEVGDAVHVQAVVPGMTRTEFHLRSRTNYDLVPKERIMDVNQFVDAALVGFDRGERVTIPSLPDTDTYARFIKARADVAADVSRAEPAPRYRS